MMIRAQGGWRGRGYDCGSYEDPKRGHTEAVGMIVVHMRILREGIRRLWV